MNLKPMTASETYSVMTLKDGNMHVLPGNRTEYADSPDIVPGSFRTIGVIGIIRWIDEQGLNDMDYMESGKVLREWCNEYNGYYFSAPREEFFVSRGIREAAKAGNDIVIVEDLS